MHKYQILVISEFFAPMNSIASIRFTKILKYLSRTGKYSFWIITRKYTGKPDEMLLMDLESMKDSINIIDIDVMDNIIDRHRKDVSYNPNPSNNTSSKKNAIKFKPYKDTNKKEKIYKWLNTIKYLYNERVFVARAMKEINDRNLTFDMVISTYGDSGAHFLAKEYIKNYANVKWIADYRDPAIMYYRPRAFDGYFNNMMDFSIKRADFITGVNKTSLGRCASSNKARVVINGFDMEDKERLISRVNSSNINDGKFHICYTGRVYDGKSNGTFLFKAINELANSNKCDLNKIQFDYAGQNFDLYESQLKKFGLGRIAKNHGYVSREESLRMQNEADLLLVLSWNDDDEEDMLTGKFMEYLMAERPILAIVNGNKVGCTLANVIKECNVGYCFESAQGEKAYDELKAFLLVCFDEFRMDGSSGYKGIKSKVIKYDYSNIANYYDELIMSAFNN